MTMVMTMTSKDLHIAIKRNDGMEYLLNKFGFQEESVLFEAIRKVVPAKSEEFIKILKKKQKKLSPKTRTSQIQVLPEKHEDLHSEVNEPLSQEAVCEEEENEVKEEKEVIAAPKPTLEQLLNEEKEISSKICRIEGEHKELVAQRRVLVAKLEKARTELKKLKSVLEEQEKIVTTAYTEFLECAALMENLNEERSSYDKQLKDIRSEIENLKKVTIFVYENGTIEVNDMPIEYIEESAIVSVSKPLYDLPEAEELTVKEIKAIAKLEIVVQMMERGGYKTEIIFGSARVQKFWETVITV